jgi:hypothetical protein
MLLIVSLQAGERQEGQQQLPPDLYSVDHSLLVLPSLSSVCAVLWLFSVQPVQCLSTTSVLQQIKSVKSVRDVHAMQVGAAALNWRGAGGPRLKIRLRCAEFTPACIIASDCEMKGRGQNENSNCSRGLPPRPCYRVLKQELCAAAVIQCANV